MFWQRRGINLSCGLGPSNLDSDWVPDTEPDECCHVRVANKKFENKSLSSCYIRIICFLPWDIDANFVVDHLCEMRIVDTHCKKEFAPIKLDNHDGRCLKYKGVLKHYI